MQAQSNKTLTSLVHAHVGRPAIVLGGAPCLLKDLAHVQPWADSRSPVLISANDHAFQRGLFEPSAIDYIVACDTYYGPAENRKRMEDRLRVYGRPIIAPRHWADYRVLHQIVSNSGALGCVVAWALGCAPIVVCGVELFGGGTYWHNEMASSSGKSIDIDMHLRRWQKLLAMTPGSMIRPVSGPLLRSFTGFHEHERVSAPAPDDLIRELIGGQQVEITRDVPEWNGKPLKVGDVLEVRPAEAGILIAQGWARRYPPGRRAYADARILG